MRKKLFHGVIFLGAISNALALSMTDASSVIIISTTILYVVLFELVILFLEPRLVLAVRKRNVKKYPFMRDLLEAKRATIKLENGETLYNAAFTRYIHSKDAKTIVLDVTTPKTKKQAAIVTSHQVMLANILEVKKVQ
ncbi:response regulator [Solibacillus sp. FSL H8-0538]|uniref:response regulator n=1 Tax=Solibacillus sp. FSL H8-0538 TaxID=2921400 RepID=UPI0030F5AA6E